MKRQLLGVAVLLVGMLTACTAGGGSGGQADGKGSTNGADAGDTTLRVAFQSDIASFDPDNNFEVAGLGAILGVYQGLVTYAPGTTEIKGLLAKSWTISPDGLTYTFALQDGVKFGSGTPMTSADVKASFERRMTPELELNYFLANVDSMQTPAPDQFVIKLKSVQPGLLDSFASPWGPKVVGPDGLVTNAGSDHSASWLNEHADGTGPFLLKSFVRGQGYELDQNPNYWGPKPAMSTISIKIIPDIGQQVLQLRNGDLDMVLHGYPFAQLDTLPEGLKIETYNDLGLELAFINPKRNLTSAAQRNVVKAGLDPAGWVKDAFGDYAQPATSLFPAAMLTPATPYQWTASDPGSNVAVPALEIGYASGEAGVQQRVADLLISQLAKAGVTATARALSDAEYTNFSKDPMKAPDIYLAQNNPDSADPGSQAGLFYTTGAGLNIMTYSNPQADELFATAATSTDTKKRNDLFDQGAHLIFDDGGFVPLADVKDVIVYRGTLKDFGTKPAVPWSVDFGSISR